jgi:DMSO/TMAO reductase YedYZ molybdopterin-dependent catalytic subunit
LTRSRAAQLEAAREATGLPTPTDPVALPQDISLDIDGIAPWQTSNAEFYRIDTQLSVPRLDREGWTLRVHGQVDQERTWTLDELEQEFEVIERAITLTCVSNEIGGNLVGTATWTGVRVADVLEAVGVDASATQLVGRAFDDFTVGYPVEAAFDRDAMLVVGMNGEPLPAAHGFPLRMIVPGLYGYVSATKWLTELELTTFEAFDQYWVERDWDQEAPIKTMSRIDTPKGLETVAAGTVPIAGVAWAQTRGITKVEVSIDEGPWQEAELGPAFTDVTWRQWAYRWDTTGVAAGRHDVRCRATDVTGEAQTEDRQPPFPNGASGWPSVAVFVP